MDQSLSHSPAAESIERTFRIPSGQLEKLKAFLENPREISHQVLSASNLSFDFGERVLRPGKLPEQESFTVQRPNMREQLESDLARVGVFKPAARAEIAEGVSRFLERLRGEVLDGERSGRATAVICYRSGTEKEGAKWGIYNSDRERSNLIVLQKILVAENHTDAAVHRAFSGESELIRNAIELSSHIEICDPRLELRKILSELPRLNNWGVSQGSQRDLINDLVRMDSKSETFFASNSDLLVLRAGMRNGAIYREPSSIYDEINRTNHTLTLKVFIEK